MDDLKVIICEKGNNLKIQKTCTVSAHKGILYPIEDDVHCNYLA